jgi:hypothetical protein
MRAEDAGNALKAPFTAQWMPLISAPNRLVT